MSVNSRIVENQCMQDPMCARTYVREFMQTIREFVRTVLVLFANVLLDIREFYNRRSRTRGVLFSDDHCTLKDAKLATIINISAEISSCLHVLKKKSYKSI